jgi:uncharacterized iron-regulated protein
MLGKGIPADRGPYMSVANKILRSLFLFYFSLVLGACAEDGPSQLRSAAGITPAEIREGQIIDTATGRSVSIDQVMERLEQQEVVYVGEEHHNRFHIENTLALLNRLTSESRRPMLAMEMFGWESQALVDRYLGGDELSRPEFLAQVNWKQNWGGPFEDYERLVSFAKTQRLRLAAMNPPKSLVRLVARNGLEQARREPDWDRWGMQKEVIVDDPLYRERILQQLRACHDAGPDKLYQTMYEASMVRDEGMAKTVVSLVKAMRAAKDPQAGPIVSYTGGGHIQFNLPVPKRVARRLSQQVRQISIYMTAFEGERLKDLQEMIVGKIADYVWLTPLGAQGSPRRCR